MDPLTQLIISVITFIDRYVVFLIFTLAFALFLFGILRYFFAGTNDEKRKEGRTFILWGIIALVVMIAVWGFVNLIVSSLNLDTKRPCIPTFGGTGECSKTAPGGTSRSGTGGVTATDSGNIFERPEDGTAFGDDPDTLNGPGQPIGL